MKTHIQNFSVPAPISHPLLTLIPNAKYRYNRNEVGFIIQSRSGAELFRFHEGVQRIFKTEVDKNKLFSIPIVRDVIYSRPQSVLFKDLFQKDIFFGFDRVPDFSQNLLIDIIKTNWEELIYNLFLYKLRQEYLNFSNIESIGWNSDLGIGVVDFKQDKTGEKREILYFLRDGFIYSLETFFKDWNVQSGKIRSLFIENVSFLKTHKDASVAIYGEYRTLPF